MLPVVYFPSYETVAGYCNFNKGEKRGKEQLLSPTCKNFSDSHSWYSLRVTVCCIIDEYMVTEILHLKIMIYILHIFYYLHLDALHNI